MKSFQPFFCKTGDATRLSNQLRTSALLKGHRTKHNWRLLIKKANILIKRKNMFQRQINKLKYAFIHCSHINKLKYAFIKMCSIYIRLHTYMLFFLSSTLVYFLLMLFWRTLYGYGLVFAVVKDFPSPHTIFYSLPC